MRESGQPDKSRAFGRRAFLKTAAAAGVASLPGLTFAQATKLKVGLMLPYSGAHARSGVAIANGFKLALAESRGRLGGRDVEYVIVDDRSDPSTATDNADALVNRDKVDVLVGTVDPDVAMTMAKIARASGTLLVIPGAGADAITGVMCAPNIFRTSFTNWQLAYPMGKLLANRGIRKVVSLTWNYRTGVESISGFKDAFRKAGGTIVKELLLPFQSVEFPPLLSEIASIKPDAVFAFFTGGGAVSFLKDWQAAGLKGRIGLYGSGFLTEGILRAAGDAARGLETTLHYGDGIETPKNKTFRLAYGRAYRRPPDVYAVQGYDAGLLLAAGLKAVKGDMSKRKELYAAMEGARIDSPRGTWVMSKAHNPIQDIYLRKVVGKQNKIMGIASRALTDPAHGCEMV
jgi:branched-chain amino acid transport system substrate-binding protein